MTEKRRSRLVPEVDFEKDGKQTGLVRLFHSTHASAYGFIPIPIAVIRNGRGPTALLVSGNHGDEYEGQIALANLTKSLQPNDITGRVIILPMANFPAGMAGRRTSPIDDANLNRSFPGNPDGTVTQQIAYFIETVLIPMANLVVDLHSGGSSLMYVPSAGIKAAGDAKRQAAQKEMAEAFAAPITYVSEGGQGTGEDHTLSGGAERLGIPALGTELGGTGTVTPAALRIAERGVRNVLVHAGIMPAAARIAGEGKVRFLNVGGDDYFVYSSKSGVWEPLVELGDTVAAGQPAARIHCPETPWAPPATVHFKRAGFVLCKRIPGRTMRGDCLFHLASD